MNRLTRSLVLGGLGLGGTLLAAGTLDAFRTPSYLVLLVVAISWMVAEQLALRTSEPADYHGRRNTRILQGTVVLTTVLGVWETFRMPELVPRTLWFVAAGALVLAAGGVLRVVAIRTLAEHFRYELRVVDEQKLVDHGVFRWLRHPSYLGITLIALGAATLMSSALALIGVVATLVVVVQRIGIEETVLRQSFGAAYDAYAAKTWRLVPFVY